MNEKQRDIGLIESWINKGLANCNDNSRIFEKLNNLKRELSGENSIVKNKERKYGTIKYFNTARKFGIIEISNETHVFFRRGFRRRMFDEDFFMIEGKTASCYLIESKEKKDSMIAVDIVFEEECFEDS